MVIHQFIAHSSKRQYRKRIFRHLRVTVRPDLLDANRRLVRGTDDATPGLDLQAALGLLKLFSFPSERERAFPLQFYEAPLSTTYILSFDFLFGLALGVFASSIGE